MRTTIFLVIRIDAQVNTQKYVSTSTLQIPRRGKRYHEEPLRRKKMKNKYVLAQFISIPKNTSKNNGNRTEKEYYEAAISSTEYTLYFGGHQFWPGYFFSVRSSTHVATLGEIVT